jgi:hypothetical protein
MLVAETLVPLMVVAPKNHVLLPSETATGLRPGGVVELLDGSLRQLTITMVAAMTPMMITYFIKRIAAERSTHRWRLLADCRIAGRRCGAAIRCSAWLGTPRHSEGAGSAAEAAANEQKNDSQHSVTSAGNTADHCQRASAGRPAEVGDQGNYERDHRAGKCPPASDTTEYA